MDLKAAQLLLQKYPKIIMNTVPPAGATIQIEWINSLIEAATTVERVRCVKVVDSLHEHWEKYGYPVPKDEALYVASVEALKDKIYLDPLTDK